MRQLNTIGRYWRNKHGHKVYKVPINLLGFTCPNIDGTIARGGCTFCENDSFSPNLQKTKKADFKLNPNSTDNPYLGQQILQLQTQFNDTVKKLTKKFGAKKFIVYFQSFTNTYAPFNTLKILYDKALTFDNVVGLSIGTRTDSITDEILDYLQELNQKTEIWVEYGIQSIYDETLKRINRGHDFSNIQQWIKKTKNKGILVCGHIIFGLPDETQDMMLNSVKKSITLNIDSIKFHPLYVVKNTVLTNDFNSGKFTPITEKLYIDTLVKSIKLLPPKISISRITAGISDDSLLSPEWCKNKHKQIFNIRQSLLRNNLIY
ncbi:COG1242: Predicted Fe-S oxidoreductase [hydrothermal vent metagenome]|uniref:COG1242: Predicted Fe-S oxidoreductase n=1 Tax=hydrothermal vent metagenome TaxID=652676 RepID=A0A3B1E609_9ZZZZ